MNTEDTCSSSIDLLEQNNEVLDKNFLKDYENIGNTSDDSGKSTKIKERGSIFFGCNSNFSHSIPFISFIQNFLYIVCSCGKKEKISYEEAYNTYLHFEKSLYIKDYYKCPKVGHKAKKYAFYCFKCGKNLCENCFGDICFCESQEDLFIFGKEKKRQMI